MWVCWKQRLNPVPEIIRLNKIKMIFAALTGTAGTGVTGVRSSPAIGSNCWAIYSTIPPRCQPINIFLTPRTSLKLGVSIVMGGFQGQFLLWKLSVTFLSPQQRRLIVFSRFKFTVKALANSATVLDRGVRVGAN